MNHSFCHYRKLIVFSLFIGSTSLSAQTLKGQNKLSKPCLQKMKLVSDKFVLTKNNFEMSIPSEIMIDPINSTMNSTVQHPNKQEKTITKFRIKEIKCNMNEDLTSGNIVYLVKRDNENGTFSNTGFILKATKEGLSFFSNTDPEDDTSVMLISKYEIIK